MSLSFATESQALRSQRSGERELGRQEARRGREVERLAMRQRENMLCCSLGFVE